MGSCLSKKSSPKLPSNPNPNPNTNINTNTDTDTDTNDNANAMEKQVMNYVQPTIWQVEGSKEEEFFDSKGWLESDDEDFLSVYGDSSPTKQVNDNEVEHEHQAAGRRLSDLFKERSFSRDTQTSLKAAQVAAATTLNNNNHNSPTNYINNNNIPNNNNIANNINNDDDNINNKLVRKTSAKRCLPSLVRSLSCGECKKKPGHVAVIG